MKYAVILIKSPQQHMVFCSFDGQEVNLYNYTGSLKEARRLKESLEATGPKNAYKIIRVIDETKDI